MSTPSQTDWAVEKAEEILLTLVDFAGRVDLLAAALRRERERCAQIVEASKIDRYWEILGDVKEEVVKRIREGA